MPQLKVEIRGCNISGDSDSYIESENFVGSISYPVYPCGQMYLIELSTFMMNGSRIVGSSAILADHSTIVFSDYMELLYNRALRDGAMYLGNSSVFFLTPHTYSY